MSVICRRTAIRSVAIPNRGRYAMNERQNRSVAPDFTNTQTFSIADDRDAEVRRVMNAVYAALVEKGYNPINQIVGYLISEDPTYIINYKNARSLIRKVERDELLSCIIKYYLGI